MSVHPENIELSALPIHVREEVERWQALLKHAANCRPVAPLVDRIAMNRKVGRATVYRKLRAFEEHGWRGLVNRAKFPINLAGPSFEFRVFLHALWLINKKRFRITHQQVVAMWKGGAKIPGYSQLPKRSGFNPNPTGWTYANFVYHINKRAAEIQRGEEATQGELE